MKNFLIKLKREGTLELVEPSKNVSGAYQLKAKNCLLSAKILFREKLYENAVSQAYYAMYNSIQSLLFLSGIKCENHSAAIFLLEHLFGQKDLRKMLSKAKKERIDKDYYVTGVQNEPVTEESALKMIKDAEHALTAIQLLEEGLLEKDVHNAREKIRVL
jgi:uncharacterized protein (UPF0332 family)